MLFHYMMNFSAYTGSDVLKAGTTLLPTHLGLILLFVAIAIDKTNNHLFSSKLNREYTKHEDIKSRTG